MCLCSFSYSFLISLPFICLSLLSGFDWRRISDVSSQRQIVNNSVAVELCCLNFLVLANFLENSQPENDLIFWKQSCCISDHVSKLTWVDSVLNVQKVLCTRRQLQNRDETEIFLWDTFYFQCPFRGLCHIVNILYKIFHLMKTFKYCWPSEMTKSLCKDWATLCVEGASSEQPSWLFTCLGPERKCFLLPYDIMSLQCLSRSLERRVW